MGDGKEWEKMKRFKIMIRNLVKDSKKYLFADTFEEAEAIGKSCVGSDDRVVVFEYSPKTDDHWLAIAFY